MTEFDESAYRDHRDEAAAALLLRLTPPRTSVPADRTARVRETVHAQWRAGCRRRAVRRRVAASGLLVAAAGLVVLVWPRPGVRPQPLAPAGELVAVVEVVDGIPHRIAGSSQTRSQLSASDSIHSGDLIETDRKTRAALRFSDGTSVRLDAGSRVRPLSSTAIELDAGGVYVDTGRESGRFEVRTPVATVRDVGTQFELRLLDRRLRLRVRSGAVEVRGDGQSVTAGRGTEIVSSDAGVSSRPIAVYGPDWDWTTRVSPPLDIDGTVLAGALERLAREHGWALEYGDPGLAREARDIILHGSVRGLTAAETLDVVMATSGLRHHLDDGKLRVFRPSASQ